MILFTNLNVLWRFLSKARKYFKFGAQFLSILSSDKTIKSEMNMVVFKSQGAILTGVDIRKRTLTNRKFELEIKIIIPSRFDLNLKKS